MAHITVAEERYQFTPELRRKIYYLLGAGVVLFILGVVLIMVGGGHEEGGSHASVSASQEMVASLQDHAAAPHAEAGGEHEGSPLWLKRTWASVWTNNMFFLGLGIIGLFFVAIQYASAAGWSAGILRIPLAMGQWLPIAGILTLVLYFIAGHTLFHWTHADLYIEDSPSYDKIIDGKGPYFYWPLASGSFPLFYLLRMVLFFGLWYWFFVKIRKNMLAEDLDPSTSYWFRNRSLSAWFLVFFAVSSSIAAWDWIMSIDTHWYSTLFGWYIFASWWVTGLAFITLVVADLKSAGYLKIVNANHLHDLGKFVFAFSIFWTYIWFGQFLLYWYANIPEEMIYFFERVRTSPYSWIFYANLILNFVLPLLLFMTRDSKRHLSTLKLVCPIVIIGHWFDFYELVTPGIMQEQGGVGFVEIGTTLIFLAAFYLVMYNALARVPLIGRNHPMLEESLYHDI